MAAPCTDGERGETEPEQPDVRCQAILDIEKAEALMVNRRSCLTGSKLAAPLNEEMRAPTVVDWIAIFPNKKMAKAVVRGPSQASDKPPKIDAKQDLFSFFLN